VAPDTVGSGIFLAWEQDVSSDPDPVTVIIGEKVTKLISKYTLTSSIK
jgi:hypothetical protein